MAIGFNPSLYSVNEGAGVVTFTVQNRNPDLEREVTVQFTTTDGTASGMLSITSNVSEFSELQNP